MNTPAPLTTGRKKTTAKSPPVSLRICPSQSIVIPGLLVLVLLGHFGVLTWSLLLGQKPEPAALPLPPPIINIVAIGKYVMPALGERPSARQPDTLSRPPPPPLPPRFVVPHQTAATTFEPSLTLPAPASQPDEPPDHRASASADPSTLMPAPAPAPASFNVAYLANPPPSYPALSRLAGEQGTVVLRVRVEASGLPGHIELQKSSGFERLDTVARNSVQSWRFTPSRHTNTELNAWVDIPITFNLENPAP